MSPPRFKDSFNVAITVTSDGTSASVDGGNVKEFDLELQLHGFSGEVRIWIVVGKDEDEYFDLVKAPAPLELELKLSKAEYLVSTDPEPLRLSGLVTMRRIREIPGEAVAGNPALYREYTLQFADAANVLWSQHHPTTVYADAKLEKVIQDNTPAGLKTELSWSGLKRTRPLICLGLGEDSASFYDFLFWLTDVEHGQVYYDYSTQTLTVADSKPANGTAVPFAPGALEDTQGIQMQLAEPPRAAINLLNSRDKATAKWAVDQPNASSGVRRDYMIHTAVDDTAKLRQATEKARYASGRFDVTVHCDKYPEMYLAPGELITLAEEFSEKLFVSGESLRLLTLRLSATATSQVPEFDIESDTTEYEMDFVLTLEATDDVRHRGPSYQEPRYPLEVEGKILSAVGSDGDRSYTLCGDTVAESVYKVSLPNWNATIAIAVTPDFVPGHLYFPVIKDSRAFISLSFSSARIARFLEWGTDVTVPNASQGNQLMLGRNDKSETSVKHWYVDGNPELVVARQNAADQGTVTVKEGLLILEITEESGGSSGSSTVSVEPEMQMAKAESSQKADVAVADMQDAADNSTMEMSSSAQDAAAAVQQKAEAVSAQVDQKSESVQESLQGISDGISEQVAEVEAGVSQVKEDLEDLLK